LNRDSPFSVGFHPRVTELVANPSESILFTGHVAIALRPMY